jgi:hypothetical protein
VCPLGWSSSPTLSASSWHRKARPSAQTAGNWISGGRAKEQPETARRFNATPPSAMCGARGRDADTVERVLLCGLSPLKREGKLRSCRQFATASTDAPDGSPRSAAECLRALPSRCGQSYPLRTSTQTAAESTAFQGVPGRTPLRRPDFAATPRQQRGKVANSLALWRGRDRQALSPCLRSAPHYPR